MPDFGIKSHGQKEQPGWRAALSMDPLQVIYKFITFVWQLPSAIRCSMCAEEKVQREQDDTLVGVCVGFGRRAGLLRLSFFHDDSGQQAQSKNLTNRSRQGDSGDFAAAQIHPAAGWLSHD